MVDNNDTANDEALAAAAQAEEDQAAVAAAAAAAAAEQNEGQNGADGQPRQPLLQREDIQGVRDKYGAERMQQLAENVAQIEKMEQAIDDDSLDKILCVIGVILGIVLFFCLLFIIILAVAKSNSEGCGIAVYEWLMFYFALLPIFLTILLPLWCLCRVCNQLKVLGAILIVALIYMLAVAAYIIFGYFMYFSKSNDCQSQPDTSIALIFMCIFLIFGLIQIIWALVGLCVIPMAYIAIMVLVQKFEDEKREFDGLRDGFKWAVANYRMGQDDKEKVDDTCAVCLDSFKDNDGREASRLPCGHVFHVECIISWIDQNHIDCPLCKKPIPHAKKMQEQLNQAANNEGGNPEDDDEIMSTVRKTGAVRRRLKETQQRRNAE